MNLFSEIVFQLKLKCYSFPIIVAFRRLSNNDSNYWCFEKLMTSRFHSLFKTNPLFVLNLEYNHLLNKLFLLLKSNQSFQFI